MKTTGYLQLSDDGKILVNCTDKNVSSVVIPNGVAEIGKYAFDGCTGLTLVEIPGSVTKIGRAAFSGCMSLTSVNIPSSVTWIGEVAFCGCISLTRVEIPSSVTEIGDFAFSYCTSIEKFIVDEDNPNYCAIDGVLLSKCKTKLVSVYSSFVGKYTIPSSVTEIGKAAFDHCTSLTSVEIPSSVTEIGWGAFDGCASLASVEIPSSVAEIGEMVFCDCTNLTSVEIPDSVTEIGRGAFDYCTSLTELHCRHKQPLDALSECFEGVDVSRITLYVPSGSVDDYRHHPFFSRFGGVVNVIG